MTLNSKTKHETADLYGVFCEQWDRSAENDYNIPKIEANTLRRNMGTVASSYCHHHSWSLVDAGHAQVGAQQVNMGGRGVRCTFCRALYRENRKFSKRHKFCVRMMEKEGKHSTQHALAYAK